MDIQTIVHQLAYAIYQVTNKPKPRIKLLSVSSQQVKIEMQQANIKLLYPRLLDYGQPYYYTTAKDWADIMNYIYFQFTMPPYIAGRMDCENFAILINALISYFFKLNYQGLAFGWANLEGVPVYHSWNYLRTDGGFVQWEPQARELGGFIGPDDIKYRPEYVLL